MKPLLEKPRSPTIQHRLRPISLPKILMKPIPPNTSKVGAFLNVRLRTHRIANHLPRAAKVTTRPLSTSQHIPQAPQIRWPSRLPHLCLPMTELAQSQIAEMFKARITGQSGPGIKRLTLLLTSRIGWVDRTEATRIVLLALRVKTLLGRLDREIFPVQTSRPRIASGSQTFMEKTHSSSVLAAQVASREQGVLAIQHRPRPIPLLETLVVKPILANTSKVGAFLKTHLQHLIIKLNRKILWLRGCIASSEVY